MQVVCCQLNIVWENKPANHTKVRALLDQAGAPRGSLVVLPEMFATGFSMDVKTITDTSSRETYEFLSRTAADYGIFLVAGIVQNTSDMRGRNECIVFSPSGDSLAQYCKIHPFSYGGETNHYVSGEQITVFKWHEFTVSPFICYDLRFPEIFRSAVVQGAQLFVVIANWPASRVQQWIALLKARAIENQAYVAAVNRCGTDPKLSYSGHSMIIDPRGEVLADAGEDEGIIKAEIDMEELTKYRREFPFLNDIHREYVKTEYDRRS